MERLLRVCGDSLRRMAETETAGWHSEVLMPVLEAGMTESEMLQGPGRPGVPDRSPPRTALLAIYHGQQEHT
jgi:hypothetical protein